SLFEPFPAEETRMELPSSTLELGLKTYGKTDFDWVTMNSSTERISTGNEGLDAVLRGGIPGNRLYLLEGSPGSGKTTLALEFLLEGRSKRERGLYITLSETKEELEVVAASHGWNLDGIDIFELSSADDVLGPGRDQSILHSWEMELGETIKLIKAQVE